MTSRRMDRREQGRRPLLLAVVAALALASSTPVGAQDFAVSSGGNGVSVRAVAAELPDLLDMLARETGMKVEWELQPRPRPLVTVAFDHQLPRDAVTAILEGLRFNYALGLDASGKGVRILYIVDATPPPPLPPSEVRWPARVRWGGVPPNR